ncbi:unnamed protein product [Amoebophrya sp. A120]|nr:unnamed protein product [Amoebophrya sp. A120]|eukprot:GSA120T00017684001.1
MDNSQEAMMQAYLASKAHMGQDMGGFQKIQNKSRGGDNRRNNQRGGQWGRGQGGRGGQDDMMMGEGDGDVPITVRNFLEDFAQAVQESRADTVEDIFVKEYPKLSEGIFRQKHGKNQKWPSLEDARACLSDNHNVHLLYKELYYRHLFSRLDKHVTAMDRVDAWNNYQDIFDRVGKDLQAISDGQQPPTGLLQVIPVCWLWEMLDEFLYHYTTYCFFKAKVTQQRAKLQKQLEQDPSQASVPVNRQTLMDFDIVKEQKNVFDSGEVFYTLKRLVMGSNIDAIIRIEKGIDEGDVSGISEQAKFLGYFAKIQQVRYHLMLGEYDVALKRVGELDFGWENALYYRCPAAHVSFCYFVAFSLFMSERYSDCLSVVSKTLHFIQKLQRFPPLQEQYAGQLMKQQDRMVRLFVLCQVFSPDGYQCIPEENVANWCADKYADDIKVLKTWGSKDVAGPETDMNTKPWMAKLVEFFNAIQPRFVTILDEDLTGSQDSMEGHKRQWELFWGRMMSQRYVPWVRNVLRMYSKISLAKLTSLCNFRDEEECKERLAFVESKNLQIVMDTSDAGGPSLLPGLPKVCTDVNFSVKDGEVQISIQKQQKDFSSTYIREIHLLDKIAAAVVAGA